MKMSSMVVGEPVPAEEEGVSRGAPGLSDAAADAFMENVFRVIPKDEEPAPFRVVDLGDEPGEKPRADSGTADQEAGEDVRRRRLRANLMRIYGKEPSNLDPFLPYAVSVDGGVVRFRRGPKTYLEEKEADRELGASRLLNPDQAAVLLAELCALRGYSKVDLEGPESFKRAFYAYCEEHYPEITTMNYPTTDKAHRHHERAAERAHRAAVTDPANMQSVDLEQDNETPGDPGPMPSGVEF